MHQTKNAVGNLVNRYKAVLKKCHILNVFGSLALAGTICLGMPSLANAADPADLGADATGWNITDEGTLTGDTESSTYILSKQALSLTGDAANTDIFIKGTDPNSTTYTTGDNSLTLKGTDTSEVQLTIGDGSLKTVIDTGTGAIQISGASAPNAANLIIKGIGEVKTTHADGIAILEHATLTLSSGTENEKSATVTGNVLLNGTGATLSVSENDKNKVDGSVTITEGILHLSGGTKLTITKNLDITSSDASLAFNSTGNLTVEGELQAKAETSGEWNNDNLATNGTVEIGSLNLAKNGDKLAYANIKENLTIIGTAKTDTSFLTGNLAATGLKVTANTLSLKAAGEDSGGTYTGTTSIDGGTLAIEEGSWHLGDVNITKGEFNIAGAGSNIANSVQIKSDGADATATITDSIFTANSVLIANVTENDSTLNLINSTLSGDVTLNGKNTDNTKLVASKNMSGAANTIFGSVNVKNGTIQVDDSTILSISKDLDTNSSDVAFSLSSGSTLDVAGTWTHLGALTTGDSGNFANGQFIVGALDVKTSGKDVAKLALDAGTHTFKGFGADKAFLSVASTNYGKDDRGLNISGGNVMLNGLGGYYEGKTAVSGGTLAASGGNWRIGETALTGGTIHASAGQLAISKLEGKTSGTLNVTGGAKVALESTSTFLGASKFTVANAGSTLKLTADSIMKWNAGTSKYVVDTSNYNAANSSSLGAADGSLVILTGYAGQELDLAKFDSTLLSSNTFAGISNSKLAKAYEGNNIVFAGAKIVGANTQIAGNTSVAAGEMLTIMPAEGKTDAKIASTAIISVPAIAVGGTSKNLLVEGGLVLDGALGSTTELPSRIQTLTIDSASGVDVLNAANLLADETVLKNGLLRIMDSPSTSLGILQANGGTIFVDPSYVRIDSVASSKFASKLLQGVGGMVSISKNNTWAEASLQRLSAMDTSMPILAMDQPLSILITDAGAGQVVLDKGVNAAGEINGAAVTSTLHFGKGSLLMINAPSLAKAPALDASKYLNSTLYADPEALLHIHNAKAGDAVAVALVQDGEGSEGWLTENVRINSALLQVKSAALLNGTYLVELTAKNAKLTFPLLQDSSALFINGFASYLDENSSSMGARFISRVFSNQFLGENNLQLAVSTFESAVQMAAVGGVSSTSLYAATAAAAASAVRISNSNPLGGMTLAYHKDGNAISLENGLSAGNAYKNGVALWATPLYQHSSVSGQHAGAFKTGYNSNLLGVSIGADYTMGENTRFGAAFNVGGVETKSKGGFTQVRNSANFYGFNVYGGYRMDALNFSGDIGYLYSSNSLKQNTPQSLLMAQNTASVHASVWSFGIKGEYKFAMDALDITPYLAMRFNAITTNAYTVKNASASMFRIEKANQNVWMIPVGISVSKEIASGDWKVTPQLSLGAVFAAGDLKAHSRFSVPNYVPAGELIMRVVDPATFDATVGLGATNNNFTLGLNYNLQLSQKRSAHSVFGTLRYSF